MSACTRLTHGIYAIRCAAASHLAICTSDNCRKMTKMPMAIEHVPLANVHFRARISVRIAASRPRVAILRWFQPPAFQIVDQSQNHANSAMWIVVVRTTADFEWKRIRVQDIRDDANEPTAQTVCHRIHVWRAILWHCRGRSRWSLALDLYRGQRWAICRIYSAKNQHDEFYYNSIKAWTNSCRKMVFEVDLFVQ